jgi:hypothetical protein
LKDLKGMKEVGGLRELLEKLYEMAKHIKDIGKLKSLKPDSEDLKKLILESVWVKTHPDDRTTRYTNPQGDEIEDKKGKDEKGSK